MPCLKKQINYLLDVGLASPSDKKVLNLCAVDWFSRMIWAEFVSITHIVKALMFSF